MNAACEVALERPQRFFRCLAFCLAASEVVLRRHVNASLRYRDPMQR
jgi:hypothetical protein